LLLNPASLNLVRPELARLIRQAQTEFDSAVQQDPELMIWARAVNAGAGRWRAADGQALGDAAC
jgi:hypothetical protein